MNRPTPAQIEKWYPPLLRTAIRLTGSGEEAADITQEAFGKALGAWDRFDGKARPTTWLHRILVNCVRDWRRRRSVRSAVPLDEWDIAAAQGDGPLEQLDRSERAARLRSAIAGLPTPLKQAFVVTVLDGYTYEGAAELLALPVGTVASRVHQARNSLRETMHEAFPET